MQIIFYSISNAHLLFITIHYYHIIQSEMCFDGKENVFIMILALLRNRLNAV